MIEIYFRELRQNLTNFASKINDVANDVIHVNDIKNDPGFRKFAIDNSTVRQK